MSPASAWIRLAPSLFVVGLGTGGALYWALAEAAVPGIWRALITPEVARAALLSLWIAGLSTLISTLIAVPAAIALARPGSTLARALFALNLPVPHLVGALGILYLFGQSGSFARGAYALGLIEGPAAFPAMIWDPAAIGIILTFVWKEVPFVGLILLARLQAIGPGYAAQARSLGARPGQVFAHILLPMLAPALIAAAALVFAYTFGAFEVAALLGQSDPQALPVLAYRAFVDPDPAARPVAMALSLLVAGLALLCLWLVLWAGRRPHP